MSLLKRLVLTLYPIYHDVAEEVVITTPDNEEIVLRYTRRNHDQMGGIKLMVLAGEQFKISRRKPAPEDQAAAKERDAIRLQQLGCGATGQLGCGATGQLGYGAAQPARKG